MMVPQTLNDSVRVRDFLTGHNFHLNANATVKNHLQEDKNFSILLIYVSLNFTDRLRVFIANLILTLSVTIICHLQI